MRKLLVMGVLSVLGFGTVTSAQRDQTAANELCTLKVQGMT